MKVATMIAVCACLSLAAARTVKADMGDPFNYTITDEFADGAPTTSYTSSGTPPTAAVSVYLIANYSCTNTDTRSRNAAPSWYDDSWAVPVAGGADECQGSDGGSDPQVLGAGETVYFEAETYGSGDLWPDSWTTGGYLGIFDLKTPDNLEVDATPVDFTVS